MIATRAVTQLHRSQPALLLLAALLALIAPCTAPVSAADPLPPKPARYFNDYTGSIPPAAGDRLNEALAEFERQSSSQILVVLFPKLPRNAALEDFTVRTAQAWGVGRKKTDNGAVLFVFVQDRLMRIEVGYGLEGPLPDARASQIINDVIKPHFQRGDLEGGVTAGANAMMQAVRGEYQGTGRTVAEGARSPERVPASWMFLLLLAILFIRVLFRRSGTGYHRGRRTYWGGGWPGGGGGGGGGWWGGGGGGGGGFSGGFSGGGGSFGGGGASGRW